jgi:hypothetical protein
MVKAGHIGELGRALAVLALVFFNFAHVPVAFSAVGTAPGWAGFQSSCGDPRGGGDRDHTNIPCHACRIGAGADLPLPPHCPAAQRLAAPVRFDLVGSAADSAADHAWPSAGAPPRSISSAAHV